MAILRRRGLVSLLLLGACTSLPAPLGQIEPFDPSATPARLHQHMSVLADDSLRGRGTGTREYDAAARYVANEFQRVGLTGVAEMSARVPLETRVVDPSSTRIVVYTGESSHTFSLGRDFVVMAPGAPTFDANAAIVFVGHGLAIPERGIDDYARVDVRGKIAAFLPGAPAELSLDERTYWSTQQAEHARAHGAVAAIRLWTPNEEKSEAWEAAVASYEEAGLFRWANPGPRIEQLWAGPSLSAALMDHADSAAIAVRGARADASSRNVVALLAGADPTLSREYVVVSAHLDHLGIRRPVRGDSIYNGAVDDASGVAAVIELARELRASTERPRRSILFVAFGAEEPGSLGAADFVAHPPVDRGAIVANVNVDGASVWPFDGLVPRGAEHSSLYATISRGAERTGVRVVPDPAPGRQSIAGSDQYAFMTAGIPSAIIGTSRPSASRDVVLDWVRNRYHQPSDDMQQPLDFTAAASYTHALAGIIREIANAPARPVWNAGDFYARFATPPRRD